MPKKTKKPKKPNSREYLETALDKARELLPGWMFAVIHRHALPASGGRAARNRRLAAAQKAWIEGGISPLTNSELKSLMADLYTAKAACDRKGFDDSMVRKMAGKVAGEMAMRGASEVVAKVAPVQSFLSRENAEEICKGFNNGEPEGGMHAHGLDRKNDKTFEDGPHIHLFVAPGSGEVFITEEDGGHAHAIDEGGNQTENDGVHSHRVFKPNGEFSETKLGGEHSHELMVETSGFSGLHRHTLRLPDGTELQSLSPGEFVARFVDLKFFFPSPIHSSREITSAMNEARVLRDQLLGPADGSMDFPPIEGAVDLLAKGEELPPVPNTHWEVVEIAKGGAQCQLADMTEPCLMKNPTDLVLDVGDVVEVNGEGEITKFSKSAVPNVFEEADKIANYAEEFSKATSLVEFRGPQDAKLVFVSASPSVLEMARKEALAGPDGALFQERYLKPLGLTKADVATGFAIPVPCDSPAEADVALWRARLMKALSVYDQAKVVALGRVAKQALGESMDYSLPHPAAVRRHGDRGEVDRKVKTICKALDIAPPSLSDLRSPNVDPSNGDSRATLADSISELSKGNGLRIPVTKSTAEKQIVYGVILDPYVVDLHNDWLPPAEIETTAHDFMANSRVIGLKHNGVAEAEIVESWVEAYPTTKDRELALQNLPHKVYRRAFGSDTLHSGAWVAGVKLSDELWAAFKKGDLDAFSIGGFSFKTQISTKAMPDVEFIDLLAA